MALDFGRIIINSQVVLYLFGTRGPDRFWFMWKEPEVPIQLCEVRDRGSAKRVLEALLEYLMDKATAAAAR